MTDWFIKNKDRFNWHNLIVAIVAGFFAINIYTQASDRNFITSLSCIGLYLFALTWID
jgi:hypothetical protein